MSGVLNRGLRTAAGGRLRGLSPGEFRRRRRTARLVSGLSADVVPPGITPRPVSAQNGVTVLVVDTEPEQVVRAATDAEGRATIRRHRQALEDLHDDPRCADLVAVLPTVVRAEAGGAWLVESAALGEPETALRSRARPPEPTVALRALDVLHDCTAVRRVVDEADRDGAMS